MWSNGVKYNLIWKLIGRNFSILEEGKKVFNFTKENKTNNQEEIP